MARPSIVRADTLDLQDQDNPSASEHQKPQIQSGLAPHQASQLHLVDEERHEEEQSLADAWNMAGTLTEEPGAIDEAQANAEHERMTNGTQQGGEEGGEGGESEAEGDDDMLDRISSSPSIDDGGSTLHSSPPTHIARLKVWPARSSSLSPTPTITPTRGDFNSSASPTSTLESSPFLRTPQHLPLRRAWMEKEASPLSKAMD
ncbi:hypothetical protein LTR36_001977 [Oleoguttula mirabilis]|uniref:Uncharacterized protein n=1 Tax=Oleoguttula mirabilis TaxID=1507867 RepID=A0AAV9JLS4_9PEZI|nr:hypothetical protein LTR36_001977 [Oleoguttula mirabilis]